MNKKSAKLTTLAAVVLSLFLSTSTKSASAVNNCKRVKANQSVTNNGDGTTDGVVTNDGLLNGTTHDMFTSLFTPTPDPSTVSFTDELRFTTDKGILTTSDVSIFDFVHGVFTTIARVKVSAGTGEFQGATGILFISGKTSDGGSHFEDEITGEICLAP